MTRTGDDILEDLKKKSRKVMDDLKEVDIDRETASLMNSAEEALSDLSRHIENKRRDVEDRGVEQTVKRDARKVQDGVKKAAKEVEDLLDGR